MLGYDGSVGDGRALPLLEAAEADTDPEVRKLSRIAIARLRQAPEATHAPGARA